MRPRSLPAFLLVVLALSACAFSSDVKAQPMSQQTRLDLVRAYTSELVYAHTTFPIGKKGLTLKDGKVTPEGKDMEQLLAMWGPAVKPGEQLMITNQSPAGVKASGLGFDLPPSVGSPGCGPRTFGHNGSTGTLSWADPDTGTICVVLTTLYAAAVSPLCPAPTTTAS